MLRILNEMHIGVLRDCRTENQKSLHLSLKNDFKRLAVLFLIVNHHSNSKLLKLYHIRHFERNFVHIQRKLNVRPIIVRSEISWLDYADSLEIVHLHVPSFVLECHCIPPPQNVIAVGVNGFQSCPAKPVFLDEIQKRVCFFDGPWGPSLYSSLRVHSRYPFGLGIRNFQGLDLGQSWLAIGFNYCFLIVGIKVIIILS